MLSVLSVANSNRSIQGFDNSSPRSIFNHMVEHSTTLNGVFQALSDPTRRTILHRLTQGPATVTEIAAPIDMSLNGVSKHLLVLERAGLLRRRITGREHHCYLNAEPLSDAAEWVDHYRRFWESRLDSLESWLIASKKKPVDEEKKS